jgi:hypothetical protein
MLRTLTLTLMLIFAAGAADAQTQLPRSVVANGGVEASSATRTLTATLGQPVAARQSSASRTLRAGFWHVVPSATATAVEPVDDGTVPAEVRLRQNYPNPFNPQTTIRYAVPEATHVRLVVYDMLGRAVETLVDRQQAAGQYEATFDARDLPSGAYLYQLDVGATTRSETMMLVK